MGNFWKGISNEELVQAEANLLKRSGLTTEDFKISDTRLDESNEETTENYIHSVEIMNTTLPQERRNKLPVMVLIHGYGAGCGVFFKVVKDLSLHFHIYMVDMLGMGASGRPEYDAFSVDLAEDFFVNAIKTWKHKIGINEKFYLAGHSLGGYISSIYALRHPEDILKLLLLSPVGVPEKPDDFKQDEIVQNFDSFKGKMGARIVLKLWDNNFTPFGPLRFAGSLGTKAFLNFYLGRRMKSITDEEELADMKSYLHQIFLRPASGELALTTILSPGAWAKSPLLFRLPTLQVPVSFFYGEFDWMDATPALILIQNQQVDGALYVIEGSDHHLYLDNPGDMIFKILVDVFGEEVASDYKVSRDQTSELIIT